MGYVDFKGNKTQLYPHNPNGSSVPLQVYVPKMVDILGVPHPERSFLKWQLPWCPVDLGRLYTLVQSF